MRILLFHIALLLCAGFAFGQGLAGRRALPLPNCYKTVYENTPITGKYEYDDNNDIWVVYAINEGAVTSTGQRLAFMDAFFVLEQDKQRLHLVKHDPTSVVRDKKQYRFTEQAQDAGWIGMQELLIWPNALKSADSLEYHIKGLLGIAKPRFSHSALLQAPLFDAIDVTGLNQFYLLKREGNAVLLGREAGLSINPEQARPSVLGWIDASAFVRWGTQVAIMSKNGAISPIPSRLLLGPDARAVPALTSACALSVDSVGILMDWLERMRIRTAKVNVVFVLDGGDSAVWNGMQGFQRQLNALKQYVNQSQQEIRIGASLYGRGQLPQTIELTPEPEKFDWLASQSSPPGPANVMQGIAAGLNLFRWYAGETNLLVVVGRRSDASDDPAITVQSLAKGLSEMQIGLHVLQVGGNPQDDAGAAQFGADMQALMHVASAQLAAKFTRVDFSLSEQEMGGHSVLQGVNAAIPYRYEAAAIGLPISGTDAAQWMLSAMYGADSCAQRINHVFWLAQYGRLPDSVIAQIPWLTGAEFANFVTSDCRIIWKPGQASAALRAGEEYVVLMEQNDLGEMIGAMKRLTIPGITRGTSRSYVYDCYANLSETVLGGKVPTSSFVQFFCRQTGVSQDALKKIMPSDTLLSSSFESIRNPLVFTDDAIMAIILHIADQTDRLESYSNNVNNRFFIGGKPYYWVPLSLFP